MKRLFAAMALALAAPVAAQDTVAVNTVREADGTTTMTHEAIIGAAMPEVWAAVSTPEGWMGWAVPLARWSADEPDVLETSYDPTAEPGSAATIRHRFLARIPGRLLAFRTVKAPEGFPHAEAYYQVTSVFELEAAGEGTRIRLTSTGYPDNEAGRELVAFFSGGNAETLEALRRYLSHGRD